MKLLDNYHEIYEKQFYLGDYGATDSLIDLETAIEYACLTDRQRECLQLKYAKRLKQIEISKDLGIARSTVSTTILISIRKIARFYEEGE